MRAVEDLAAEEGSGEEDDLAAEDLAAEEDSAEEEDLAAEDLAGTEDSAGEAVVATSEPVRSVVCAFSARTAPAWSRPPSAWASWTRRARRSNSLRVPSRPTNHCSAASAPGRSASRAPAPELAAGCQSPAA